MYKMVYFYQLIKNQSVKKLILIKIIQERVENYLFHGKELIR